MGTLVFRTVSRQPGPTGPATQNAIQGDAQDRKQESAAYRKMSARAQKRKNMTSRDDKDGQGRPQTIGKQSARAPKLQHDKNDDAKYIGKTNMGARGRRSDAERFERHAAWERDFWKKIQKYIGFTIDAEVTPRRRREP